MKASVSCVRFVTFVFVLFLFFNLLMFWRFVIWSQRKEKLENNKTPPNAANQIKSLPEHTINESHPIPSTKYQFVGIVETCRFLVHCFVSPPSGCGHSHLFSSQLFSCFHSINIYTFFYIIYHFQPFPHPMEIIDNA